MLIYSPFSHRHIVYNAFCLYIFEQGPVDVLINCAGTSIAGEFNDLKSSDFEKMM